MSFIIEPGKPLQNAAGRIGSLAIVINDCTAVPLDPHKRAMIMGDLRDIERRMARIAEEMTAEDERKPVPLPGCSRVTCRRPGLREGPEDRSRF